MGSVVGLFLREQTWYYRRSVPEPLRPFFGGRRELWIRLKTKDHSEARPRGLRVAAEVEQRLITARKRLSTTPTADEVVREYQRLRTSKLRDVDGSGHVEEPLTRGDDDSIEAIDFLLSNAKEDLERGDLGEGFVLLKEALADQGVILPKQDRRQYAIAFLKAHIAELEDAARIVRGEPPAPRPLTVAELVDAWIADRAPTAKTASEWRAIGKRFATVCGASAPVTAVTKAHVRDFKATLLKVGSRQGDTLSRRTVQKHLMAMGSVFRWGLSQDYVTINPFDGLTSLPKDRSGATEEEPKKRRPFTLDELRVLFGHEHFSTPILAPTPPPRRIIGTGKAPRDFVQGPLAARYWLPILGLYSAARVEELAGLRKTDVCTEDGITHLNIVPHKGRALKTSTSRRRIPLHRAVIQCGFMEYVQACPDGSRLFEDLRPGRHGKLGGPFSTWFARYMDEQGLTDPRLTFHSLRHTVADALRRAKVEPELRSQILGHGGQGMTARYGAGHDLKALFDAIATIEYPDVKIGQVL